MRSVPSKVSGVLLREFRCSDALDVAKILTESPTAAAWSAQTVREGFAGGATAWVAALRGTVVGFLVGRRAADEFEILNLAILPPYRRRGIGSKLLVRALGTARKAGSERCYIEVRCSNQGAIGFYAGHGFRRCGRRKDYYRDPVEDAIVFVRKENES